MDERELQDPENWDFTRAKKLPGVKNARAVVSVAFPRDDFQRVAEAAKRAGQRTSEYIRQAAIEKTTGQWITSPGHLSLSSSLGAIFFTRTYLPETKVSGPAAEIERDAVTA